jgi:hypothetical protein
MYRLTILVAALSFSWTSSVFAQFVQQDDLLGNINFFFGQKTLDKDDWEPVHEQSEFGIELDLRDPKSSTGFIVGYFLSSKSVFLSDYDLELEGKTIEINIGGRKDLIDHPSPLNPFIGGGFSIVKAEARLTDTLGNSLSGSDTGLGLWLDAGVRWMFKNQLTLGGKVAFSHSSLSSSDISIDAGGLHYGLLAGFHW